MFVIIFIICVFSISQHRSHFGSRYLLGCCNHACVFFAFEKPSLLSAAAGSMVYIYIEFATRTQAGRQDVMSCEYKNLEIQSLYYFFVIDVLYFVFWSFRCHQDKSAGRQWYKMCNRVLTDLNHRCTLRTAPEEFNLSANQHEHDPTASEFMRSYMSQSFPGLRFVKLIESEMSSSVNRERRGVLPVRREAVQQEVIRTYHIEELVSVGVWMHVPPFFVQAFNFCVHFGAYLFYKSITSGQFVFGVAWKVGRSSVCSSFTKALLLGDSFTELAGRLGEFGV